MTFISLDQPPLHNYQTIQWTNISGIFIYLPLQTKLADFFFNLPISSKLNYAGSYTCHLPFCRRKIIRIILIRICMLSRLCLHGQCLMSIKYVNMFCLWPSFKNILISLETRKLLGPYGIYWNFKWYQLLEYVISSL